MVMSVRKREMIRDLREEIIDLKNEIKDMNNALDALDALDYNNPGLVDDRNDLKFIARKKRKEKELRQMESRLKRLTKVK